MMQVRRLKGRTGGGVWQRLLALGELVLYLTKVLEARNGPSYLSWLG